MPQVKGTDIDIEDGYTPENADDNGKTTIWSLKMYLLLKMMVFPCNAILLEGNTYSGLETGSPERTQFCPLSKVFGRFLIEFTSLKHIFLQYSC